MRLKDLCSGNIHLTTFSKGSQGRERSVKERGIQAVGDAGVTQGAVVCIGRGWQIERLETVNQQSCFVKHLYFSACFYEKNNFFSENKT